MTTDEPQSKARLFSQQQQEAEPLFSNNNNTLSQPACLSASPPSSIDDDTLPTNVCHTDQLSQLPSECLSGNPDRPLLHFDASTDTYSMYSLRPLSYAAGFVLLVETMERLSFYGLNYTQASYLTGSYNPEWNADMDAITASTYVAVSVAVAYTTPFLGVALSNRMGDYKAILTGCFVFYLPGVMVICLTSVPHLWGSTQFNRTALSMGLLALWPAGTGIVKSLVNVFGARQFHPLLQSSLIEAYYVKFYMCINIGALMGGIVVPIVAQTNVTVAYTVPVVMLAVGVCCFLAGTNRYVRTQPSKVKAVTTDTSIPLSVILRICLLIVPFNIAYSQMATTFIVQGTVMAKAFGWMDAASMNNADAVAVLVFGHVVGDVLYPWCARHGYKLATTYKFALGSCFGAAAIAWALLVEGWIHSQYAMYGTQVSILWQAPAYILIGCGEIFAVSAAYEVAFTASPPDKKVVASAVNLFCIGGMPNILCVGLYQAGQGWFRNSRGTASIMHVEDYVTAHVSHYFWLLFWVSIAGFFLNILPPVRDFVEAVEEQASEMVRTPKTPSRPPIRDEEEASLLLKMKQHRYYLKYGTGPQLYKMGSMRAAVRAKSERNVGLKRHVVSTLYRSDPVLPKVLVRKPQGGGQVVSGSQRPAYTRSLSS